MISTGKGVEKILGRKGTRSGEKRPTWKGGKRSSGGKGGKGSQQGRVGKILGRKGGGGGEDLREEREKIWEKRT